ncbi:MAG: mannitol dehydrogenase family protein [Actinomycetota bacterium]
MSERAPERIVHLGLGAFHRAHQAWYTQHASDAEDWGIVAFTGRRAALATTLEEQYCLYTLVERGPERDRFELISSIVRAVPGDDVDEFVRVLAAPETAILTLTITEAGYLPGPALDRIALGLRRRLDAGSPSLAIVPCDNLPDNGGVLRRALEGLDPSALENVSFVSTSVDRITPRAAEGTSAEVEAATGWRDAAPVVTEPFADWALSGEFPSGRPAWETAGARFVDDIEPWELRKLWMLNGAHTLLAAEGRLLGHSTVAEAIADSRCLAAVRALWAEDARHLPDVDLATYSEALLERFRNPRIVHSLDQIAIDSLVKLRVRIVPVALRERAAGRAAEACAHVIAAWIASTGGTLEQIDRRLAADAAFASRVHKEFP